jgi:hypothetical protein
VRINYQRITFLTERELKNYEKLSKESKTTDPRQPTKETGDGDGSSVQGNVRIQPPTAKYGATSLSQANTSQVDLDKLAYAIAMSETKNCTKGVGASQNNCFGIRNGNTAPCKVIKNRFCAYEKPEESYEAFKIIWSKWYGGLPDIRKAKKWTATQPHEWLANVLHIYHNS